MKINAKDYIDELIQEFATNANSKTATGQAAYMKNKFAFFGIMTPLRKHIQKPFLQKENLPEKKVALAITKKLWQEPQRELHYFSQELLMKYKAQAEENDIELFEWMIAKNSWWDTVDMIAIHLTGNYFQHYPEARKQKTEEWLMSKNIWLQRAALLFQLKYKKQTDTMLLAHLIKKLSGTNEFFINKAIGWALREYAKTDKLWVEEFAAHNVLSNLSKKEAMKHF